jgi:peptidoglycan/LPS O-acetylase OafA/YrhL
MKAPELPALTGIRFFAASLVFAAHITYLPGMTQLPPFLNLGNFGVAVFFVLSGFILTYNYARLFSQGVSFENYARFIWDRLAKIYPLYLLTLILAIPIELVGHHRNWSWESLAMQLTLLQCILPLDQLRSIDHFNVPGWSISCEMLFYLLAPLLIWLGLSGKRPSYAVILGWLAAIVLAVTGGIWAVQVSAWPACFAPARVPEFLVGVTTAVCYLKGGAPSRTRIHLGVTGGFFLLALSIWANGRAPQFLSLGSLSAPGAALLIYGLAYGQGRIAQFLSHRWMELLGMSSFAFYLTHDLIIRICKGAFMHFHISVSTPLSAVVVVLALFILTQFVSICLFKTFEVPTQKYLRRLARKKNPDDGVSPKPEFAASNR